MRAPLKTALASWAPSKIIIIIIIIIMFFLKSKKKKKKKKKKEKKLLLLLENFLFLVYRQLLTFALFKTTSPPRSLFEL